MKLTLVSALILFAFFSCASSQTSPGDPEPIAFISYPLAKLRPTERPAGASAAAISLAGYEYECAGLGLWNPGPGEMEIVGIEIAGPDGSPLSCDAYLVEYANISRKSRFFDPPRTKGRWPDPCVPLALLRAGEGSPARAWASPPSGGIKVPAQENRYLLLEFYLPPGKRALAETWSARITWKDSDGTSRPGLSYALTINSRGFDLPALPSAATACHFSRNAVVAAHARLSPEAFDAEALYLSYLELLARHRLFVHAPNDAGIPVETADDGSLVIDWSGFDALTGAMLDGTLFPGAPPATSFGLPGPTPALSGDAWTAFYRSLAAHMRERGWLDRMYYYALDEPLIKDYWQIRERSAALKEADPGIRVLATEPYATRLERAVDIWCPDIPYLGDSIPFLPFFFKDGAIRPEWQPHYPPSFYARERRAGKETWLYTCNTGVLADYPDLFIDADAAHHRIIPWLMRRYGFTGFLYWHLVIGYDQPDPWGDPYVFPANGDGTLLYPGVPGAFYLDEHVPLATLRMKALREGFEDYEYLALLARLGMLKDAERIAKKIAKTSTRWEDDPAVMMAAREEAALAIEAALR